MVEAAPPFLALPFAGIERDHLEGFIYRCYAQRKGFPVEPLERCARQDTVPRASPLLVSEDVSDDI